MEQQNQESLQKSIESQKKVWELERTSILQKAMDIVGPTNRGLDYGHPLDNFEMEAELMNVWHRFKYKDNNPKTIYTDLRRPLDWKDMAIHKIFMKIVRELNRHKEDNSVDIAGYSWCLEEAFIENQKRRGGGS